ncbi:hypothetical protein D3C73_1360030 [compost metagenome]
MHGHWVHKAGEKKSVATYGRACFLQVVSDFAYRADDRVACSAAACLEDLAQRGTWRGSFGEVFQRALVAVGAQLGKRGVEVELLEVDDGEVGN